MVATRQGGGEGEGGIVTYVKLLIGDGSGGQCMETSIMYCARGVSGGRKAGAPSGTAPRNS